MGGRKKDGNGRINIDFITENESQSLIVSNRNNLNNWHSLLISLDLWFLNAIGKRVGNEFFVRLN
jgi:hypothetical protein